MALKQLYIRCVWVIVRMYYICARIVISTACMPSRGGVRVGTFACVCGICMCVCVSVLRVCTQQGGMYAREPHIRARIYIRI